MLQAKVTLWEDERQAGDRESRMVGLETTGIGQDGLGQVGLKKPPGPLVPCRPFYKFLGILKDLDFIIKPVEANEVF